MKKRLGYLNKRETELIRSLAKELRDKLGEEILCIRLFDCKVRGDFHAESDIGVSVLAKEELLSIRRANYREAAKVTELCHTQSP
ncbi:MAG: hypothetical protein E3J66_00925 [Dehalococcoidia bacterium]|nr:MAG: hypothetical protein E3J66_00925 [Dehalococcoidia bacterium]